MAFLCGEHGSGIAVAHCNPLHHCGLRLRAESVFERQYAHVGAKDVETKVAALVALGGTAETLEPVVWEQEETYAKALAAVEDRIYSHTWRLPDELFRTAAGRLRAEVEAAHPDLDRPHRARHQFTLTAVRF